MKPSHWAVLLTLACVPAPTLAQPAQLAAPAATPRTAAGLPDLTGYWARTGGGFAAEEQGDTVDLVYTARDRDLENFQQDNGVRLRSDVNKPHYRPEHWEKVRKLDMDGNLEDPEYACKPAGVPRMGPPTKIVQTPTELIFLYEADNTHRIIPIDGRPRDPVRAEDQTFLGDSLGHWEGDTMVIETVGFNDVSWLDFAGYFHSAEMKVTERLRREGTKLHYQVTVEDPVVLLEPWRMNPRVLTLNPDPRAQMLVALPCEERSNEHIVDHSLRG